MCAKKKTLYDYCVEQKYSKLLNQWDANKNAPLTPQTVTAGSNKKVWWQCQDGHIWEARIDSRTNEKKHGCPVCDGKVVIPGENDLASAFPDIAAQWHPEKNAPLTPERVTPYSNKTVWWICEQGHEYKAVIPTRTIRNSGCPYCVGRKVLPGFNDLATKEPKIAAQWHPELNGDLTPEMVTAGSNKAVWWKCQDGHVWKARVDSRATGKKHGCPLCAGNIKTC